MSNECIGSYTIVDWMYQESARGVRLAPVGRPSWYIFNPQCGNREWRGFQFQRPDSDLIPLLIGCTKNRRDTYPKCVILYLHWMHVPRIGGGGGGFQYAMRI